MKIIAVLIVRTYYILNLIYLMFFRNPRVPCRAGILPKIDFSKWAEFPNKRSDFINPFGFQPIVLGKK